MVQVVLSLDDAGPRGLCKRLSELEVVGHQQMQCFNKIARMGKMLQMFHAKPQRSVHA